MIYTCEYPQCNKEALYWYITKDHVISLYCHDHAPYRNKFNLIHDIEELIDLVDKETKQ